MLYCYLLHFRCPRCFFFYANGNGNRALRLNIEEVTVFDHIESIADHPLSLFKHTNTFEAIGSMVVEALTSAIKPVKLFAPLV